MTTQIPDARLHLIRYYGAYSHRSRGARRAREAAAAEDGAARTARTDRTDVHGIDSAAETAAEPRSRSRASWARLIRRIYEVDPLLCPRCQGPLTLISVLVDPRVVDAILRHLDVSDEPVTLHARDPPAA